MWFYRKKRRNKRLEKQLISMYHDIMGERHAAKEEFLDAMQEGNKLLVIACVARISCLYQYALRLIDIMNENDIDF